MNAANLIGKTVVLNHNRAPLEPCRFCGCKEGNIRPGVGPHLAQVRCNGCDRGLGWLSADKLRWLAEQEAGQ